MAARCMGMYGRSRKKPDFGVGCYRGGQKKKNPYKRDHSSASGPRGYAALSGKGGNQDKGVLANRLRRLAKTSVKLPAE
jgi:hypothetical protein